MSSSIKKKQLLLKRTRQLFGTLSSSQNVVGSIPGENTYLGRGSIPSPGGCDAWSGHLLKATNYCFSLTSTFLSLPSFLPTSLSKRNEKMELHWHNKLAHSTYKK